MNRKKTSSLMMIVILTVSVLAVSVLSVQGQSTTADFTGVATFSHPEDPGSGWLAGGIEHIRGQVVVFQDVCTDSRVTGYNTLVTNWNINTKTGVIIMWGKFSFDVDDIEGGWKGTFKGNNIDDGVLSIFMVGHGTGELVGLKIVMWAEDKGVFPPVADLSGFIVDLGGE